MDNPAKSPLCKRMRLFQDCATPNIDLSKCRTAKETNLRNHAKNIKEQFVQEVEDAGVDWETLKPQTQGCILLLR